MPKLGSMQGVKVGTGKQIGKRIGKMKSIHRKMSSAGKSYFGFRKKG